MKAKNVQIPLELFNRLLYVLEYIDMSNYAEDYQNEFGSVLEALQDKKKRMELREDYGKMIDANKSGDEDKQIDARIQYLQNKRNLER